MRVLATASREERRMSRTSLHVFVPTNRAYESARNWGKPAPLDGLNEIIAQNRANRFAAAKRERENVKHVADLVRAEMRRIGYAPMTKEDRQRAIVYVRIFEPHDGRDVSNVLGGVLKYTLDALTARNKHGCGAIWDDNTKWLAKLVPQIIVDPEGVGVAISIVPLED